MAKSCSISRSSAYLAALAAFAMVLALVVAAPASAAGERQSNLDMARAAGVGTTFQALDGDRSYADGHANCWPDAEGDEIPFNPTPGETYPANEPRADILTHCANYAATVSLSVNVNEPTDPETDPAWQGATFLGWFIDTPDDDGDYDGDAEYFVEYHLDGEGDLVAYVRDLTLGDDAPPACTVRPTFTGIYHVSGIDRECFGDPDGIQVAVAMFYDTDPEGDDDSGVWFDAAPSDGTFEDEVEAGDEARETLRLSIPGGSRIDTSVAISRYQFDDPDWAARVYLARADDFPDALAGGSVFDGPILLVNTTGPVAAVVLAEIARLDPDEVVALGGTAAVSDEVLAQAAGDRDSARLSIPGGGRIDTAIAISNHIYPDGETAMAETVYLARADDFPDALAGGVLTDGPVLLVNRTGPVPAAVRAEIERLDPDSVIALGGLAAVAEETLASGGEGYATDRLSIPGGGRTQTAIAIAQRANPWMANEVYLARADEFPDALAGGVLTGGPILLVPRTLTRADGTVAAFPEDVADEISRLNPQRVVALGGTAAVSDEVLNAAASN